MLSLLALVLLGTCGAYITVVLPAVVKELVDTIGISGTQAGYIVTFEKLGMALASLSLFFVVNRFDKRLMAVGFLLLLAASNFFSAHLSSFEQFCAVRFLCGVSEGAVIALMTAQAASGHSPDRTFGLYLAATLGLAMVSFAWMPDLLQTYGLAGVFYSMAAVAVVTIVSIPLFPKSFQVETSDAAMKTQSPSLPTSVRWQVALALAATFLFEAAIGAVWNFISLIAIDVGFTEAQINSGLSQAMIVGVIGGIMATLIGQRFGRLGPIILGVTIMMASLFSLAVGTAWLSFLVITMLFMFSWIFTLPFFVGAVSGLDPSGRAAVMSIAVQTGGLMAGPLLSAELIRGSDSYGQIIWAGLLILSLCMLTIVAALGKSFRTKDVSYGEVVTS